MLAERPATDRCDSRAREGAVGLRGRCVALRGEYDAANAHTLWNQLAFVIAVDHADLLVDVSEVTFLDASTITVFIRAQAKLNRCGRRFSLCSLSIPAERVISICRLESLVDTAKYRVIDTPHDYSGPVRVPSTRAGG